MLDSWLEGYRLGVVAYGLCVVCLVTDPPLHGPEGGSVFSPASF